MVPLRTFYTLEIPSSQTACCFLVTHIQSKGSSKGSRSSSRRGKKKNFWQRVCNSPASGPSSPPPAAARPAPVTFPHPPSGSWQSPREQTASELYSTHITLNTKKYRRARLPSPASALNGGASLEVLSFSHPLP